MLLGLGAAVLLVIIAAVASVALGVGPLVHTASRSVVYVAISRSTDEADAHEIEAIDLAAGTRDLFDASGRITAMVVSPDRRTLYVAVDAGRVVFLDATTGAQFAEVDLHGPIIASLVPEPSGHTLFAVTTTNLQSSVVPIDLDTRTAGAPLILPPGAGSAVLQGDTLLVPIADVRSAQLVFISARARAVTDRLTLPRGSLAAPVALRVSDSRTAVAAFAPSGPGGGTMHLYLVTDPLHWEDVPLPVPGGIFQTRGRPAVFAAAMADGTIEVCLSTSVAGLRYRVGPDKQVTFGATECGPMAGGAAELLLARRDQAQLVRSDAASGAVTQSLPLAGVPARLAR